MLGVRILNVFVTENMFVGEKKVIFEGKVMTLANREGSLAVG